jgi:cell division initiation protein
MADEVTPLTPEGLRSIKLDKALRGYDPKVVDQLLRELSTSLEGLYAERTALKQQITQLEKDLAEYREAQSLMRDALVSAQRAADELKERTERECNEMIELARVEASEISSQAVLDRERAEAELKRLRSQEQELRASYKVLLAAALDRLEGEDGDTSKTSLLDALSPRRISEPSAS